MIDHAIRSILRSHEPLVKLLADPENIALGELPQGKKLPAVVYTIITNTIEPGISEPTVWTRTRVQMNPLSLDYQQALAIHNQVRIAMTFFQSARGRWRDHYPKRV